jgi:hypothetical protein
MYAGVPATPGLPLWTLYAWAFTKLLPFSNIAWRIAVSSAVAGALACGVIALSVSRGGAMILGGMSELRRLSAREETWLRVVGGVVAGTVFGFHRSFWGQAVIVESTALAMLLFASTLCLLLRWWQDTDRNRFLYAAALAFGLTLTIEMQFAAALIGLPFLVLFRKPSLGRDIFFALTALIWTALWGAALGYFSGLFDNEPLRRVYRYVGIGAALVTLGMIVITRRLLTEWRAILAAGLAFLLPLSLYLYVPLASMTNPPMNWGYPRTVEGFFHVITRGQYERLNPTDDAVRFIAQTGYYITQTIHQVGIFEFLPAFLPFCFLKRMGLRARGWMLGLSVTFLSLSCFMVAMMNYGTDRASLELFAVFFIPSHVILALWTGYGLCLAGTFLGRKRSDRGWR